MELIDEQQLESDPNYRYAYLARFIGFGPEDAARIQQCAPYLGPAIPELVEQTYERLLSFTATARHFLPRQAGYEGPLAENLAELTASHPQVQFRREHLSRYFMQILGRSFDDKMVQYLDMVGKIHTSGAGNAEIHVPLVQMNALMGVISDVVTRAVSTLPLDSGTLLETVRSFNKLFWIQSDFISRHYTAP